MSNSKVAAGFVIFRRFPYRIEYLLLQTSYGQHHWTPPKGHVDPEDISELETAFRETEEEAGLKASDLKVYEDSKYEMEYIIPGNHKKTVYYWLAELINSSTKVKLSNEHQEFQWVELNEALTLGRYKEMRDLLFNYDEYIRTRLID